MPFCGFVMFTHGSRSETMLRVLASCLASHSFGEVIAGLLPFLLVGFLLTLLSYLTKFSTGMGFSRSLPSIALMYF